MSDKSSLSYLCAVFLFFLLVRSGVHAQTFQEYAAEEPEYTGDFLSLETTFYRWRRSVSLDSAGGWKWMGRWIWYTGQRVATDGSLPGPRILAREFAAIAEKKEQNARQLSGESLWRPVGPTALAPLTDDDTREFGLGRINCMALHPTDPDVMWVGVAQGGVWKTVNGGQSWMPLTDELPMLRISDIALDPSDPDIIYISVGDYAYLGTALETDSRKRHTHYGLGVFKTTDGGENWFPTGLSYTQTEYDGSLIRRVFVDPTNSAHLVAAGVSGIWKSGDAGNTWRQTDERFVWDIEQHPTDPATLYASTGYSAKLELGEAGILFSTDFGENWERATADFGEAGLVQRIEIAVSTADPDYLYAVAGAWHNGMHSVHRSTDGGRSWSLRADEGSSPNILGRLNGSAEFFDNIGGQSTYDLAVLVDPADRERVYVGGVNIWGSEDGGRSWDGIAYWTRSRGPSIHADHHFFAYNPLNDRFFFCNDGGIYTTDTLILGSWDLAVTEELYRWPTEWQNLSDGLAMTSFYRVATGPNAPEYLIAGAQDNSTYYKNGDDWVNLFGGDGMDCLIDPTDPAVVYGSSQYGYLHSYDHKSGLARYQISGIILTSDVDAGEWVTPIRLHPQDPNLLYAAYGDVWVRDNTEGSWASLSSFPKEEQLGGKASPASAFNIARSEPRRMYVAKRPWHGSGIRSQVFRSDDGGTRWVNITQGLPDTLYYTSIEIHPVDPDVMWLTASGFSPGQKVFRTTDAGLTWTNISADLPNIPANVIVHDPDSPQNTVYVGMDIGVFYRNDTTDGWALYNSGLPNAIISDLEVEPVSGKLVAATFGRGLWEVPLVDRISTGVSGGGDAYADMRIEPVRGESAFLLISDGRRGKADERMQVLDITGRRVDSRDVVLGDGRSIQKIHLDLPYGLYFVVIGNATYSRTFRYVVDR